MTDTNQSSGACCGGTSKTAQSNPRHLPAKPDGGSGCGCGDSKRTSSEVPVLKPITAEKANSGCCGGK